MLAIVDRTSNEAHRKGDAGVGPFSRCHSRAQSQTKNNSPAASTRPAKHDFPPTAAEISLLRTDCPVPEHSEFGAHRFPAPSSELSEVFRDFPGNLFYWCKVGARAGRDHSGTPAFRSPSTNTSQCAKPPRLRRRRLAQMGGPTRFRASTKNFASSIRPR
jgi:hypothetical protein